MQEIMQEIKNMKSHPTTIQLEILALLKNISHQLESLSNVQDGIRHDITILHNEMMEIKGASPLQGSQYLSEALLN